MAEKRSQVIHFGITCSICLNTDQDHYILMITLLLPPVLGAHEAVPDARQAPAGLLLPAPRAPQTGAPLHPGADHLPGRPLDPQVHLPGHHLPRHGECVAERVRE